uniref:Peptidase M12A domain-containing protein n=1 Tax=Globodera pallida TaxID=36090 RepID=A0A183BQD7_GLOPA
MAFATVLDQGPTINVGPEATDWPRQQDPAMIAPYLCKQQIPQNSNVALRAGIYYRLIMRQSIFGRGTSSNIGPDIGTMPESSFFGFRYKKCPAASDNYVRYDAMASGRRCGSSRVPRGCSIGGHLVQHRVRNLGTCRH